MKIAVFGITSKNISKRYKSFAQKIILRYNKKKQLDNSKTLNIIFVNDNYIKKLNKQFLGRNRPTDVLAFPIESNETIEFHRFSSNQLEQSNPWLRKKIWAEIYISLDRAKEQAKQLNIAINEEICNLIKHGVLHLLEYTHEQMQRFKD